MNALWNAPISDRFSSLCARVFSPAAAILESEKTLGTRLGNGQFIERKGPGNNTVKGQLVSGLVPLHMLNRVR